MNKKLKLILIIGIEVLVIVISSIGGFWLGYRNGVHAEWWPIHQDMSTYMNTPEYIGGKELGIKEGSIVNYKYWYEKGRQEQIDYMLKHTEGGIKWIK